MTEYILFPSLAHTHDKLTEFVKFL